MLLQLWAPYARNNCQFLRNSKLIRRDEQHEIDQTQVQTIMNSANWKNKQHKTIKINIKRVKRRCNSKKLSSISLQYLSSASLQIIRSNENQNHNAAQNGRMDPKFEELGFNSSTMNQYFSSTQRVNFQIPKISSMNALKKRQQNKSYTN